MTYYVNIITPCLFVSNMMMRIWKYLNPFTIQLNVHVFAISIILIVKIRQLSFIYMSFGHKF